MPYFRQLRFTLSGWALYVGFSLVATATAPEISVPRTAVVVDLAPSHIEPHFTRVVQARVEEILRDNRVHLVDREKADQLRSGLDELERPGALLTIERLRDLARQHAIDEIVHVGFHVALRDGLGDYFSATGEVVVRAVDQQAGVRSSVSQTMGVVGNPPSDGVTASAAISNALARAIDDVLTRLDYRILTPADPRLIQLQLKGPLAVAGLDFREFPVENDSRVGSLALVRQETWIRERPTATARSELGNLAVLGSFISRNTVSTPSAPGLGGMPGGSPRSRLEGAASQSRDRVQIDRVVGARLYMIDLPNQKVLNELDTSSLIDDTERQRFRRELHHLAFLDGWRHVAGISEGQIFFWDLERGRLLSAMKLPSPIRQSRLSVARQGRQVFIGVGSGTTPQYVYQVDLDWSGHR